MPIRKIPMPRTRLYRLQWRHLQRIRRRPAEGDALTIQALANEALARQAAGDAEGCAASVAQIRDMLPIQ